MTRARVRPISSRGEAKIKSHVFARIITSYACNHHYSHQKAIISDFAREWVLWWFVRFQGKLLPIKSKRFFKGISQTEKITYNHYQKNFFNFRHFFKYFTYAYSMTRNVYLSLHIFLFKYKILNIYFSLLLEMYWYWSTHIVSLPSFYFVCKN